MNLSILYLDRDHLTREPGGTLGTLLVPQRVRDNKAILRKFRTIERPWLDNTPRESCIPDGSYKLIRRRAGRRFYERYKAEYGHAFVPEIAGVPGRSAILVHPGNAARDVVGCVAVGYPDKRPNPPEPWVRDSVEAYKVVYELLARLFKENSELQINIRTLGDARAVL